MIPAEVSAQGQGEHIVRGDSKEEIDCVSRGYFIMFYCNEYPQPKPLHARKACWLSLSILSLRYEEIQALIKQITLMELHPIQFADLRITRNHES